MTEKTNGNKLKRTVFEQSREMEFFTEKELEMQIGYVIELWSIALLKEVIDNALDSCENNNITPEITIEVDNESFTVTDNGVGLSSKIIKKAQDYMTRVSDKNYYVSPTRGQMGNALKVIFAAPFVMNGKQGKVEIWSKETHHIIEAYLDQISQKPQFKYTTSPDGFVKNGTKFKVYLPNSASLTTRECDETYKGLLTAQDLIEAYSLLNPHATFHYNKLTYEATDKQWHKWRADEPTSPHWYTPDTLKSLIAAYITKENDGGRVKTVREFVSEFHGLSSTQKQKRVTDGLSGVYLHDLVKNMEIDMSFVTTLLQKMKAESKPVKPQYLGIIGEEHLKKKMVELGCNEESITYRKQQGDDGLPYLTEVCLGIRSTGEGGRVIITGMNFSPALKIPTEIIERGLQTSRIDMHDPVIMVVHMTKPRFEFTDRGKTRISL